MGMLPSPPPEAGCAQLVVKEELQFFVCFWRGWWWCCYGMEETWIRARIWLPLRCSTSLLLDLDSGQVYSRSLTGPQFPCSLNADLYCDLVFARPGWQIPPPPDQKNPSSVGNLPSPAPSYFERSSPPLSFLPGSRGLKARWAGPAPWPRPPSLAPPPDVPFAPLRARRWDEATT